MFFSWKSGFKNAAYDVLLRPGPNGILNQFFFAFEPASD